MARVSEVAEKAEEMALDPEKYLIKAFLAGQSGTGKTQGAMTMPGRKLLIDLDNRAETVFGTPNLSIIKCHEPDPKSPKAWQYLLNIQQQILLDIKAGEFPYDSIIYDGLTMMGRIAMNWALLLDAKRGLGGAPAKQHYMPQMDNLSKFVIASLTVPRHICYTGHMEMYEDKNTGKKDFLPKITGKLSTEVSNWFSETYHTFRVKNSEGELEYRWLTSGDEKYDFFKSSMNSLGKYWEDPVVLPRKGYEDNSVGFNDLLRRRFKNAKENPKSSPSQSE